MSVDLVFARAQLEGWVVANLTGPKAEELWTIVNDLIEAERGRVIDINAGLREQWMTSSTNRDVETFSLRLSERLIQRWRGEPPKT